MLKKVLLATVAAGLLSACASEKWDVDAARTLPVQGGAFNQALHGEYIALATQERAEYDWADAAYFVAKARAVAMGETVLPTELAERQLGQPFLADGQSMRGALMAALPGARDRVPAAAAKGQAGFDCWAQEAEEGHQADHIAACKTVYTVAMAAMAEPVPEPVVDLPGPFVIQFDTASAKLDASDLATLKAAAEAYRQNKPVTVVIAGHTDAVGAENVNILLSQKRAEMVANALAELGVDTAAMALEAYGEEQPLVKTGPNEAEPRNRRVEITFKDAR